jgi:hypothetical protein
MKKSGFLQISFAWLFAIIVGAFILFLAIYATTKVMKTGTEISDVKMAKEIGILLNPLETSFETGKSASFELPVESRIYNECNATRGMFGRQTIRVWQKSFDKWSESDVGVSFLNKYIFSDRYEEGEIFYLFSKPFGFPFKVSDVIYMSSSLKKYCFVDAPEKIENEISSLSQPNLFLENCPENSINVCFESGGDCDILVSENSNYVEKNRERMYFNDDALMYAAIFSDVEVYECQLNRLMQRARSLSLLYADKINFVSRVGCNSNLKSDLLELGSRANDFESSIEIISDSRLIEEIDEKNDLADCKLW